MHPLRQTVWREEFPPHFSAGREAWFAVSKLWMTEVYLKMVQNFCEILGGVPALPCSRLGRTRPSDCARLLAICYLSLYFSVLVEDPTPQ